MSRKVWLYGIEYGSIARVAAILGISRETARYRARQALAGLSFLPPGGPPEAPEAAPEAPPRPGGALLAEDHVRSRIGIYRGERV